MFDYKTLSSLGDSVNIFLHCDTLQEAYDRIKPYKKLGDVVMDSVYVPSSQRHIHRLMIEKMTEKGILSVTAFYKEGNDD